MQFEWDEAKDKFNVAKHKLSFADASKVFRDKKALIVDDISHSTDAEARKIAIGKCNNGIATVVFTVRRDKIRIISAGFYRKERRIYEKRNGR